MSPAQSHAIVVGIEKYGVDGLTLPGPVADALDVVKWLEAIGMPRCHIHLFLASADAEVSLPVDARPATFVAFDLFRKELEKLKGDVLYLFWGGHGFLSREQDRVLFWSDVSERALDHHLNFNGFMNYLRDIEFPVQIGLIDACAESWDRKRRLFDLGRSKLSSSVDAGKSTVKQSFLFAAAEGRTTSNTPGERLTPIFLKDVQAVYAQNNEWPPNPDEVFKRVCERFIAGRRPVQYQYRSLGGDEREFNGRIGVEIPLRRLRAVAEELKFPASFLRDFVIDVLEICPQRDILQQFHSAHRRGTVDDWLGEIDAEAGRGGPEMRLSLGRLRLLSEAERDLSSLGIDPGKYQEIYSLTLHQLRAEIPEGTRGLRDILADLWDYGTNPDSDGNFALWLFLARVLREKINESAGDSQKRLKDLLTNKAGSVAVRIKTLLDKEASDARVERRHVLLIAVDSASTDRSSPGRVQAWLQSSARAGPWTATVFDWAGAKQEIAKIIREARLALRALKINPSEMWVELAVPISLMDLGYETIVVPLNQEDSRTLGRLHPVYLRWGTRLFGEDFDDGWVNASTGLKGLAALSSSWFPLEHSPDQYCSGEGLISLTFVPESEVGREKRSDLVRFGAPLLRWRRTPPVDSDRERERLDQRVRETAGTDLDLLVGELARREGEALFWDDAERTFDPQGFQLAEIATLK